jgi:hypothetical protein
VRARARLSELRFVELLEGLCERVAPFALWTPSAKWADANPTEEAERQWIRVSGDGAHVQGATGACACSPVHSHIPVTAAPLTPLTSPPTCVCAAARADESLQGAKGKVMAKEIQAYCSRLIEETEEQARRGAQQCLASRARAPA